jgi:hypothetical protein
MLVGGTARDPRFWWVGAPLAPQYAQTVDLTGAYWGFDAGPFFIRTFLPSGAEASPEIMALSKYASDAKFGASARGISGDGELVGVASGAVTSWYPHIALVGKDGRKVGAELAPFDSAGSADSGTSDASFNCLALTGTQHGMVASVITNSDLRVVELDATGQVVQQVLWPNAPLGANSCARFSADPSGIYLIAPSDIISDVYELKNSNVTKVMDLPSNNYRWVSGGEEPLVSYGTTQGTTFARWVNGQLVALSGTFNGTRIASTDGRIFLKSTDYDAGVTSIVEVACGPADRSRL